MATVMAFRKTDFALATILYTDGSLHWIICLSKERAQEVVNTYESLPNVKSILIQENGV